MTDQKAEPESGYRHAGEDRDLHLRTYLELQTTNAHLLDIKIIGVLLIASIAFPPIAGSLFVFAAIVVIAGLLGKSMAVIVNKARRTPNL